MHKIFYHHSFGYASKKVLHNLTPLKPIYSVSLYRNKSIEKTDEKNWPLMYHADKNLPDFLNVKEEDKEEYLKKAVMFRVTLDSSDKETGTLKVIRGSHIGKEGEELFIDTKAGELILFKPLLQHASNRMTKPHTRRVFQAFCIEL